MNEDWQKHLLEDERRDLKRYRYTTEPAYRCLAEARRLLREFVRCKDVRKLDELVVEARDFLDDIPPAEARP